MGELSKIIRQANPWAWLGPNRPELITKDELLEILGTTDGAAFAARLRDEAIAEESGGKLDDAMSLGFMFGFTEDWFPKLLQIFDQEWHKKHEDIVDVIDDHFRRAEALPVLFHAAQWVPAWLEWDDNRALATKAIWAIGKLGTPEAIDMLAVLADSRDPRVAEDGREQLRRLGLDQGLIGRDQWPAGFEPSDELWRLTYLDLVDLEPWFILQGPSLQRRFEGVTRRYPDRSLVPFARRLDTEEVACWDVDAGNGKVVVIQDFTPPGQEQRAEFACFYDWLRAAIEDLIAWDTSTRYGDIPNRPTE